MNNVDKQYLDLLKDIIENGEKRETRAGQTRSLFTRTMRFNLKDGFPLLTTKKVFYKGIIHELLWFLRGETNIKSLTDAGVGIWTDDAFRWFKSLSFPTHTPLYLDGIRVDVEVLREMTKAQFVAHIGQDLYTMDGSFNYRFGDLGKIYGYQWKRGDQVERIVKTIKENPTDRRLILSAWNPKDLPEMALPPCHTFCQFYVSGNGTLSCSFYMRSNDICCGLPYNIAQYALLTHMIAAMTGLEVGELIYTGGDVHMYENHLDGALEQLSREGYGLPTLRLARIPDKIEDFKPEDIIIENYEACPPIKYKLNVG